MKKVLLPLVFLLFAGPAFPQAITTGRTEKGLPWAVVELPGGDGEWGAVWLPPGVSAPAGWEEASGPVESVVSAWFPALSAPSQLLSALPAFSSAVAVILVGPVPARELTASLEALEAVTPALPPRAACRFADGLVTPTRQTVEGFRWSFPLPPLWDPRSELAPVLAFLLEKRWQKLGFTGPVRVEGSPCPLLVLEHRGPNPRKVLTMARESRAKLAAAVGEGELADFSAIQRREASLWAVGPKKVAMAGVERLGWGKELGPLLYPVEPAPAAVEALLKEVLLAYAGQAELWERERRTLPPEVRTLSSGVVLAFRETGSDVGIMAVAFSGVEGALAHALAQEVGLRAAKKGLPSQVTVALGMAAAAVVGSPEELVEALEEVSTLVGSAARETKAGPALLRARNALGLAPQAFAENLGVVLELPEGSDELAEAAEKFLSALPAGKVLRLPQLAPGLSWEPQEGPAQVVAVVELPATLPGAVAAEVLRQRLVAQGVEAELQHPAGKLVLLFGQSGQATVQQQDEALGAAWANACLFSAEDVGKAWASLSQRLVGSAAQATARIALSVFYPALGSGHWVAPEEKEVREVVAGLPGFKILPRFGVGRAASEDKRR